jgi:AraC-like DNA-binding protein
MPCYQLYKIHRLPRDGRPIVIRYFHNREIIGPHSHAFLELMIVLEDGGLHLVDNQQFPFRRGDICLLGPTHYHQGTTADGEWLHYYVINFLPEVLSLTSASAHSLANHLILREFLLPTPFVPIHVPEAVLQDLEAFCRVLLRHNDDESPNADHHRSLLLTAILYEILPFLPTMDVQLPSALLTVLETIALRYHEDLTNQELAQSIGVSPSRLCQIVKTHTGSTVKDLLVRRRLLEAKQLLSETTLSMLEVMLESGFNDYGYFSRVFKQDTGLSPTEFRRQSRQ